MNVILFLEMLLLGQMASRMKLSDDCTAHLEKALANEDPSEKDFHIRQVLQACAVDDIPELSESQ